MQRCSLAGGIPYLLWISVSRNHYHLARSKLLWGLYKGECNHGRVKRGPSSRAPDASTQASSGYLALKLLSIFSHSSTRYKLLPLWSGRSISPLSYQKGSEVSDGSLKTTSLYVGFSISFSVQIGVSPWLVSGYHCKRFRLLL